jgi:hypothetical protein
MTGLGVHLVTKRHILNAHIHTYICVCNYIYFIHAYAYIVQDACLVGFNESKVEARTPVGFESKAEKSRLSWNAIIPGILFKAVCTCVSYQLWEVKPKGLCEIRCVTCS